MMQIASSEVAQVEYLAKQHAEKKLASMKLGDLVEDAKKQAEELMKAKPSDSTQDDLVSKDSEMKAVEAALVDRIVG